MKTKNVESKVKYFTKPLLQEAVRNAEKWNFHPQLDLDTVNRLPDNGKFPVTMTIHHRHRPGEPAITHLRAMVVMDHWGGISFVDMPLHFWNRLPVSPMPNPDAKKMQKAACLNRQAEKELTKILRQDQRTAAKMRKSA